MTETLLHHHQIADHATEQTLIAMVALAPEFWPDVAYLSPESFGSIKCASAWSRLGERIRAGQIPDPREYGEFIGFDPPPVIREFAVEYAERIARDAYCRAAVLHCSSVAKAAYARDADGLNALLSKPPAYNAGSSTLESMKAIGSRVWDSLSAPSSILSTGMRGIDSVCGEGLEKQTLTILMARPGMGKTAALAQMSDLVSAAGNVVAVFSKEMSAEQWYRRIACRRAGVNWFRFKRGDLSKDCEQLIQEWVIALMERKTLWIDDSTPQSTNQVTTECERLAERLGQLDLVICDHLRLFSNKADNENHRLGQISWGLKMLARRLNTRVVSAAQLSRAVEGRDDKVPDLKDLRDSGEIEENADNVIAQYREKYYDKDADTVAEFHSRKVRDGERNNVGFMDWKEHVMEFVEMSREDLRRRRDVD